MCEARMSSLLRMPKGGPWVTSVSVPAGILFQYFQLASPRLTAKAMCGRTGVTGHPQKWMPSRVTLAHSRCTALDRCSLAALDGIQRADRDSLRPLHTICMLLSPGAIWLTQSVCWPTVRQDRCQSQRDAKTSTCWADIRFRCRMPVAKGKLGPLRNPEDANS
jgi:hypothetical protein